MLTRKASHTAYRHVDVDDPTSDWYIHQYGTWVNGPGSTCTNPISQTPSIFTYISGANFSSGVHRHEADPSQNSHYYYYKSSQDNSTFNFGSFAENQLGFSAYSDATFIAIVNGRLQNDAQALSDNINTKGEPCSQHCTADCQSYNGYGNIRPYAPQ